MSEVAQVEQEQVLADRLSNEEKFRIASWSCGRLYGLGDKKEDGTYPIAFDTISPREVSKIKRLLHSMGKTWTYTKTGKGCDVVTTTHHGEILRPFDMWVDPENRSEEWCKDFIEECSLWMLDRESWAYATTEPDDVPVFEKTIAKAGYETETTYVDQAWHVRILYPSDAPKQ